MAYLTEPFPRGVAPMPTGGPTFSTQITTVLSGREKRNQNWFESRHEFEVSHGIKNEDDFRAIGAHFRMARGKAHFFRFKDWSDFEILRAEGTLISITSTTYQLYKVYGDVLAFQEERKITRPRATISIWKGGVLQTVGSSYSIDYETGIVTFTSPPGVTTLEAACEFDVPCRYDTDKLSSTLVRANGLGKNGEKLKSWTSVPIVEVKDDE